MKSTLTYVKNLFHKRPWPKLDFPTTGFKNISDEYILEEETLPGYSNRYYPANIGEIFASRYQLVGKLGYGISSTVWLARDLPHRRYVSLKVFTKHHRDCNESKTYKIINKSNTKHPGYFHIRPVYDEFKIQNAGNDHWCLVQRPMADTLAKLITRTAHHRLPIDVLRQSLIQILMALDYVHTECGLVHTDIKTDNVFFDTYDTDIFEEIAKWEMLHPVLRKLGEYPVYASRAPRRPNSYGALMLGDFGSAVRGDVVQSTGIQPNQMRCPEVLFNRAWSYPVDIWNVGVMVWNLFEDKHMFSGQHPHGSGYCPEAHVAELIAVLGPAPQEWLIDDPRSKMFFDNEGHWTGSVPLPTGRTMEENEENLTGAEQREFLGFMRCMLQWRPEDRLTSKQLLAHPWLKAQELWHAKC